MSSYEWPPSGGGGGVTSLNGLTGDLNLVAGTGITINVSDPNITISAAAGTVLNIGTFDSGSPSANGAHIDVNSLIMQSASDTVPGLVNISTQTFKGTKTFDGSILSATDGVNTIGTSSANRFQSISVTDSVAAGRYPLAGGFTGIALLNMTFPALRLYAGASNGYDIYTGGNGITVGNIGTGYQLFNIPGNSFSFKDESTGVEYFSGNATTVTAIGDMVANSFQDPNFVNDRVLVSINNTVSEDDNLQWDSGSSILTVNSSTTEPQIHTINDQASIAPNIIVERANSNAATVPNIQFRRARGSPTSPTAVQSTDLLGDVSMSGYGSTDYPTTAPLVLLGLATQTFTDTVRGSKFQFQTTPNGSGTRKTRLDINQDGSLGLYGNTSGILSLFPAQVTTSHSLTFPSAQGAVGTLLQNDGSGILSWSGGASGNPIFTSSIDSTNIGGEVDIGPNNATDVNLGYSGSNIALVGNTFIYPVDFNVNVFGGAASAVHSGMNIYESGSVTSYVRTSSDRNSMEIKAPNTAGIATITPGAGGITLNQSSHNPVTIGTANGLSLSTQVLSLALSSTSTTGALSSTDWNTFNGKQASGNYITALTGDVTASGPGSVAATLATVNGNVGSFGSATAVGTFTVNAKGLITAASNTNIAIPFSQVSGTVPLNQGGTGQTTKAAAFDALSPMTTGGDIIYGGTSGTGTRLANGAANTILQAAGGTSAPAWVTAIAAVLSQGTVHTATFTTAATSSASTVYFYVCTGGGGGGGGTNGSNAAGGGGGAGATAFGVFSGVAASTSITIATGTGGAGGNNTGGNGSAGTASTITATGISTITANPGNGANGSTTTATAGGTGSTATNGTLNVSGAAGMNAATAATTAGLGAASFWGSGGQNAAALITGSGGTATPYGAGGGGALGTTATAGSGAAGIVIVIQITP